jgi:hypothetical protein
MRKTRIKTKQATKSSERGDRADRRFAVVSFALMILLALTGLGAWIFGNSSRAAISPTPPPAQTK